MKHKGGSDKHKLEQVVELLKFALSLEDEEIIKSTVESVIEILEEEIGKWNRYVVMIENLFSYTRINNGVYLYFRLKWED